MNKKLRSLFQIIVLCLGIFIQPFVELTKVHATEFNDVITSVGVKNRSGGDLTQGLDIWQDFRLTANFQLPDNKVHEGDTTTLSLPSEIAFSNSSNIELHDGSGNLVATGQLDAANKTITLTYTNYVENKSGVRGEFFVYVRIDHSVVSQEKEVDVNVRVGSKVLVAGKVRYNGPPKRYDSKIEKSSFQQAGDPDNVIRYNITVNRNMANYSNVTITDKFTSPNISFLPDTFKIYKVDWVWNNGDWTYQNLRDMTSTLKPKLVPNANGDGFTLPLGDTNGFGYMIEYQAKANYDLVDQEIITNTANMIYNGGQTEQSTSSRAYQIAGGVAEGYVFTINIHKVDEAGQPLQGAKFEVVRDRTKAVVGTLTTGPDGNASVSQLLRDNYTIREIEAPAGYDKLTTEIKINPTDFGTDKAVTREVQNRKTPPSTKKITFSKVNLGGTEIADAKIKIFKGETAEGNPVQSWTSEAGKTKELDLAPGIYTFHEEAAPTGYLKVTDITFTVNHDGTVTVTKVGEKDSKGEDNKVVANGSTLKVTDKDDDLPRKITFSKVNLGGTEIADAKIKIFKGDKAEGTPVESWTSEAGKTKELDLAPGTYTFHEEAAPTGYLKVTDITFKVNYDGTVTVTNVGEKDSKGEENKVETNGSTMTVTDKDDDLPRKITFSKVSLGGTEIADAKIKIFKGDKAEGTPVESWTSEAGKTKELDLAPGTYTFHEEAAPTGYLKVTDITFKVNYDGTVTVTNVGEKDSKGEENKVETNGSTVTVTDKDDDFPRKVTFSKVNIAGKEIEGAKIKIFKGDKAEGTPVASWTSEADKSKELNLAPGTYTFHEEAAPTGYLAVTDITFKVNFDGTIEVLNANGNSVEYKDGKLVITDQTEPEKPNEPNLPNTGSVSEQGTLLAGLALLSLGVVMVASNGKKRFN
ncbi:SpaA isopeptide-forming pilin-related protein [Granulicatella adiacens]|uniref:SpaA isopeptide-forming pilin-related protein n=1 Tax=Granulicatella adiacens TaxID=46124 RepID=UPI001C3E54F5